MNEPESQSQVAVESISATDLSQVMALFNEAAAKLQTTHEQLQAEVHRLQLELKAANEEVARSRHLAALGEMAAGIAHEVRNPLGSIRLHARLLEDDLRDRPQQGVLASKILQAVRGLDAVVGDVLTFSRAQRVHASWCDSMELVSGAVEAAIASRAGERDASGRGDDEVDIRYMPMHDSEAAQVWCDADSVHRALVNVIRNALQAMDCEQNPISANNVRTRKSCAKRRHPMLTVGASSRQVMTPDGGERRVVVLSVQDNGPGLPAEVMERMFNPFFTTRAAGTGLGLAIVHRIVDAHGGSVRVRNHDQGGALVELMLPVCEEEHGITGSIGTPNGMVVVRQVNESKAPAA